MWSQFTRWAFGGNPQPSRILSDELSGQSRQVNDSVYELYRPEGSPTMEMLFVPGFSFQDNSDAMLSTWLSEDGSCLWPQTWLAEEFPNARILAVSYVSSFQVDPYIITENLMDPYIITENLMLDVLHARVGQVLDCPLVLVGHSLGGTMIKWLCKLVHEGVLSERGSEVVQPCTIFLNNLRGIFYYATPHRGSSPNMAKLYARSSNPTPMMRYCEVLNREAARLNLGFENLSKQYGWKVAGLGEGASTNLGFFNDTVVSERSARTEEDRFDIVAGADHFSITRPRSKISKSFYELTRFLQNIGADQNSKWDEISNLQHLPRNIVDINSQLQEILGMLNTSEILGLVGMGGSGKTTLAKAVFNQICFKFDYSCFVPDTQFILHGGIFMTTEEVWKHMYYHGRKVTKEERWSQLRGKSLLVVLDGVSGEMQQLLELVNGSSSRSRLIVTSRDTEVVRRLGADLYKVALLDEENARHLFVSHAFSNPDTVPLKLGPLVDAFVKKCQGLPLALEVCGRYLRGKEIELVWEQTLLALNGLGGSGLNDIWATLRKSYDNISDHEQQMFLDAATFFSINGSNWTLGGAKKVWKEAYHTDVVSLLWQTLVDRLLVDDVEEDKNVKVHEVLRSLGRRIADEPNQGKRRNATEWLRLLRTGDDSDEQDIIAPRLTADGDDSKDTPHTSTALYRRNKTQDLEVSTPITIDGREGLEDFSALDGLITLKHLVITKFPGSSLPGDIGQLVALQQLQIQDCSRVKELPESLCQLQGLQRLVISNCPSLSGVPESLGLLSALRHLRIQDCEGLKELPGTLGLLCCLEQLIIWNCSGLIEIPEAIGNLGALRNLLIQGCDGLHGLPQSLGQLEGLEHLVVSNCSRLTDIPFSIGQLVALRHLQIQDCESLKILPETLQQVQALEYVTISNCSNVSTFLNAYGEGFLEERAPAKRGRLQRPRLDEVKNDFDTKGKAKVLEDDIFLESDAGPFMPAGVGSSERISTEEFVGEVEKGGEDGYFVSSKWILSLDERERDSLMLVLWMAGYSEIYETASTTFFARIADKVECSITYSNPSSKITKTDSVVDGDSGEVRPQNLSDDELGIARKSQWKSFLVTLKSKRYQSFSVSTQWLSNLTDHERKAFVRICQDAGYEKLSETQTATWYDRIPGHMQNPAGGQGSDDSPRSSNRNEGKGGDLKRPGTFERHGLVGWHSNDAGDSLSVANKMGATSSERILENPAGVRGADSSESSSNKSDDDVAVNVTKPRIFESGGLLGWLMPRRNVVNENPSGSFGEGNLRETTGYQGIQDNDVENPPVDAREDDSSSSSNRNYASGDINRDVNNRPGTSGGSGFRSWFGNFFEQILDDISSVSNGVTNETETSRTRDAHRECYPQRLTVTCSSDSDPPSPSRDLRPTKHSLRKQFGEPPNDADETSVFPEDAEQLSNIRVVTMPRTGASEQISIALDRCFSLPTVVYSRNERAKVVSVSLKARAETSLNCCCTEIDPGHLKVSVKFPQMSGVVKTQDREKNPCVALRSLWTNVYACCVRKTNSETHPEQILLSLKAEDSRDPGRRTEVEHSQRSSDGLVQLTSSLQKLDSCETGSTSLELRGDVRRRLRNDSLSGVQRANGLEFQGSHPVILEGRLNFHPESLELDIRCWLEIVYYKPRKPTPNARFCGAWRTSKEIDFNCSFEVETDNFSVG